MAQLHHRTDFTFDATQVNSGVTAYRAHGGGAAVTYGQALELLVINASFRGALIDTLQTSAYPAYFFETPPVTALTTDRPFEFVLVDSPRLATITPNPAAFSEHMINAPSSVVSFFNLSGDAVLVVPCNTDPHSTDYAHIAAFHRSGAEKQCHELWQTVGHAARDTLAKRGDRPTWLSTSGLGVYWLHFRLDSKPKYYQYTPFKAAPGPQSGVMDFLTSWARK